MSFCRLLLWCSLETVACHSDCKLLTAGLFSIEILAMCPGGSWKPLSEWEELFTTAKLKLESVKAVGCNMHLMCFVKA